MRTAVGLGLLATIGALPAVAVGRGDSGDLPAVLARVGARVEEYYGRAQSLVCEETVRFQTLDTDLFWDGTHIRELVYQLRIVRASRKEGGVPEPSITRELVSVDGRLPRAGDADACDLRSVTPEPLAMLLPEQQGDYAFGFAGRKQTRDRSVVMLDYRSVTSPPPRVTWTKDCVDIDLPGHSRGRVWADAETGDVLRLDEHLMQAFEFPYPSDRQRKGSPLSMTLERADSTTDYRPVEFTDPPERLMLPASVVSLQVIQHSGRPRLRIFQRFMNYRRFITTGHLIDDPPSR
jgi:hypothetical protein